jgi:hypothetical protein
MKGVLQRGCKQCKRMYTIRHEHSQFCSQNCANAFNAIEKRKYSKPKKIAKEKVRPYEYLIVGDCKAMKNALRKWSQR